MAGIGHDQTHHCPEADFRYGSIASVPARPSMSAYRASSDMPRSEILQLVAMNPLYPIEPMMANEADRAFLKNILESRKNLRYRFNFEAADMDAPSR